MHVLEFYLIMSQNKANYFVSQKVISSASRIAKGSNEILELGDISIIRDWGGLQNMEAMWLMLQKTNLKILLLQQETISQKFPGK